MQFGGPISAMEFAKQIAPTMQCNCDLDNWQPEPATDHSCVCRIHKAAMEKWRYQQSDRGAKP
jgi:hypothetical protein